MGRPPGSRNKSKPAKQKTGKPPKKRTKPGVPGSAGNGPVPVQTTLLGHNNPPQPEMTDQQRKDLALQQMGIYVKALKSKKDTDARFRNVCKQIKSESGPRQLAKIKAMLELESPEGEAKIKEDLLDILEAAQWMGATQLSFNLEPDRTPIGDRAFNEGENAALQGHPAKPPYDPSTEAFRRYMAGYQAGQSVALTRLGRGNVTAMPPRPPASTEPPGQPDGDEAA